MPTRPRHPCGHPGCALLTAGRYCDQHQRVAGDQRQSTDRDARPSANDRGYTWRWRRASRLFLAEHPLCFYCGLTGRITAATCVDHFVPHRGDADLFWDQSNWRAACIPCNSAKAAREEGGFGNPMPRGGKRCPPTGG